MAGYPPLTHDRVSSFRLRQCTSSTVPLPGHFYTVLRINLANTKIRRLVEAVPYVPERSPRC